MLNDPAVVTVDGVAKSLNRIAVGVRSDGAIDGSVYRDSTGEYSLTFKEYALAKDPNFTGRTPRRVDVSLQKKNLLDSVKEPISVGMHYIFDENEVPDFSLLQPALIAYITDALRARIIAGEN